MAEPSPEGPVGKTTENRPLINQFPVNPSVAFQNAGSTLGRRRFLRLQVFLFQRLLKIKERLGPA